jgi:hypothetical protein
LIEADRLTARRQGKAALDEAREEIADHGRDRHDDADRGRDANEQRPNRCDKQRGEDAPQRFRAPEQRPPVEEDDPSIERLGKPIAEELLGKERCTVREGQQREGLKDRCSVHPRMLAHRPAITYFAPALAFYNAVAVWTQPIGRFREKATAIMKETLEASAHC